MISRREIERALLRAETADEVQDILARYGQNVSHQTAEMAMKKINVLALADGSELSEDELMAVSGGKRDFASEGCALTVEYTSSCWGEDGGCELIHNSYIYAPSQIHCRRCGTLLFHVGTAGSYGQYHCPNCGFEFLAVTDQAKN